ncbi:S-layer homology domain-containing protein [Aminipila butyrica]|uniref:S-layer homology domain-containing protein n=1 Tax=Aminipila butyrica TaxID=433296 RepID=A0A858BW56_9FIRM|nr:S-layer homology domain-containing protein [Aminipila butyrica]QIB70311.1 S-layer homology domain-containing protein [Aminipila butyrica]
MKKLLCAVMAFTLLASAVSISTATPAYAGTSDSTQLKNAIAAVKTVVEIPDTMSEFSYYYDEDAEEGSSIQLSWSDKEDSSSASATVTDQGVITALYYFVPEFQSNGLAKVTKEQAQKVADGYLPKLLPSAAGTFKLEDSSADTYSRDYNFMYRMYVNGLPCDFIYTNIGINKYTGTLSSYNLNAEAKDLAVADYPSKDPALDKSQAEQIYLTELGPKLKYLSNYDYTKKKLKVFAAYETDNTNRAIDANSGKVIKLYQNYTLYRYGTKNAGAESMKADGAADQIKYTEEELKEIQRTQNLLDKTQADRTARALVGTIGSQKLQSTSLRQDWGPNQEYLWYLNYEKDFVILDGKTGTLISFSSSSDSESKNDVGLEKAKGIAEGYLNKVAADKQSQVTWTNENTMDSRYGSYTFTYTRQVGAVNFDSNQISISVDKATGKLLSYSMTWYDKAEFPALEGAIQQKKALEVADQLGDFNLVYKKDAEGKVVLVYDFQKEGNFILDAFKGTRLDYRGEAYKDSVQDKTYTDIAGNWAESIILQLKNNGYYLEGDTFAPKAATTQVEFFRYLYSPEQSYYADDEDFYKMLLDRKIITKAEINAKANITRQEAAKFVARYLGIDKLAKQSAVFKNMYTDKVAQEYLGYASAAYALGIMKGDTKGRFNGSAVLTHAETAALLLNTLNQSE